jgi:dinuclear metal center YbgI/SA1388 family protein
MKKAKLSDILGIIAKMAPPGLAESWDNPGLQVGDPTATVSRIMVALDATPPVIESALASACNLLITHHPLIFTAQKSISAATSQGASIHAAIRGGLAVVSMHTNYDCAEGGLNDLLAARIGLSSCVPLQVTSSHELAKLVVFVPEDHLEQVRSSLLPHAENLGAYAGCSFSALGEGTFTPLDGANPFIGTVGARERVAEYRLELLLDRTALPRAIKSLVAAHPYEEPAFDIYPLLNEGRKLGLGRIGRLAEPVSLAAFAARLRQDLAAPGLRFVGKPDALLSKVALCSGSGASLLRTAVRAGAHVLVTGDVKYHEAREAEELGIALVDAGHFPTEIIMVDSVAERLDRMLVEAGYADCEVVPCGVETDPFRNLTQTH